MSDKTFMFGDNKSVIDSSTLPHSLLKKRHLALCYHRVREAIASGIVAFFKIPSKVNPADLLSKHYGYPEANTLLRPLLFWRGDTDSITDNEHEVKGSCKVNT